MVLIIEDDDAFRRAVATTLKRGGYRTLGANSGREGLELALKNLPDLILLDLVLPGQRGTEVCETLKRQNLTAGIPVLILTGNDREGQEIACLDLGADDYLTKPVPGARLLARCRALLRRTGKAAGARSIRLGGLELDYPLKMAVLSGTNYPHLTPKEFGVLYELALASPEPRDRDSLYQKVWGMSPPSQASLHTVDVHIQRIRLKLGWPPDRWIIGIHGRGYLLKPSAS
jgi:two-component system phosphate regulon response regulator PhoB